MGRAGFDGFPEETFAFLKGIGAHNSKDWFEAHRGLYDTGYVGAGRSFVEAMGPRVRAISPSVQYAAKINGSISRINRDIRFSKDKRPYKDHLDLWFWHGERRGWDCPGFYLRLTPETLFMGVGMHMMSKERLTRFRDAMADEKTAEGGQKLLADVAASGPYEVAEKTRKTPPRGYDAKGASAEMLLYESLTGGMEWDNSVARSGEFLDFCEGHWRKMWPIGQWLMDHVMD